MGVKAIGYKGPSGTSEEKLKSFLDMLDNLKPGETYIFVDHPALDGPEMRAIYHIGYENVATDRQGVVNVWTSSLVMDAIKRKNIKLIRLCISFHFTLPASPLHQSNKCSLCFFFVKGQSIATAQCCAPS